MVAFRRSLALCLAPLAFLAPARGDAGSEGVAVSSFTVYTDKVWLKPGEVHNAWRKPQQLPREIREKFANRTLLIKGIDLDIVRVCPLTGRETSLPLSEVYNHHHAMMFGPLDKLQEFYKKASGTDPLGPHKERKLMRHGCTMHGASLNAILEEVKGDDPEIAAFGGATGAEFRGTSTHWPAPYAYELNGTDSFMALMHFLDMRGAAEAGEKRFECPCTKARKIDVKNGTIDGIVPIAFGCSEELIRQGNPSCSLATYQGGYRCCEDGVFLTERIPGPLAPRLPLQAKLTVTYYEDLPKPRAVKSTECCDASGNETEKGNIEYDVPQCAPGTPPEMCEHVVTSVQPLDMVLHNDRRHHPSRRDPKQLLDLVHAWGHQHVGALGMELYNEQTGQLLCRTKPRYGTGSEPGNEAGFLVGIPPCVWGPPPLNPPPRLRAGDLMRTVARYNSSVPRHGVMSLWLMEAAPVTGDEPDFLV